MDKKEKESLAAYIIDLAKNSGANELAVNINEESSVSLQYRDGEIEQLQESQQSGLSVQIYCDHKYSSHSTNDLRKNSISKFIENAVRSTKYLTADKFRELPDPKYYPKNLELDLKLVDDSYSQLNTQSRLELVQHIYETAKMQSDKIISVAAGCSDGITSGFKMHSNGFMGYKTATLFSAGAETTVRDNDSRPEDWFWASSRFKSGIPDAGFVGKKAAENALQKIGQTKIKSGNYGTIIENRAAIRLISMILSPLSAASIQQKSSYLDGMIGKEIASSKLSVNDLPFIEGALGSKLYDGEGLASKDRKIIHKGVLQQYFIDNYYGKKLGLEPNGGGISNLIIDLGEDSVEKIMQKMNKGIIISSFNGGNSNSTTGDFSFGISGFLFENGQIVQPINEMNISGNAKEFWQQLIETGNDPYLYSSIRVPSLVFEGLSYSGL